MPEPLDTSAPSPWLDRLVADHAGDLRRAARRLGFGASDVDDVVSATWETFLRVAGDFRGEAQVRTFLRGILRRKAAEFRRKARRAARPDDEVESTAWAGPDPEEQAGQTEARERLVECLGGLPPRERAAVTRPGVERRARRRGGATPPGLRGAPARPAPPGAAPPVRLHARRRARRLTVVAGRPGAGPRAAPLTGRDRGSIQILN